MAIIPLGNAGNRTPGQAPRVQIAETGQTGRALERLGAIGLEGKMQRDNDALQMQWKEHEEQQRIAEAAEKAKELATLRQLEDKFKFVTDEVNSGVLGGTVPKETARDELRKRLKEVADTDLPKFREQTRPMVQPQIETMMSSADLAATKSIAQRGRREVTVAFDQILEAEQRNYVKDPQGAMARVERAAKELLPFSDYPMDEGARKVQSWKEGSQFSTVYGAISAGRGDMKALDNAQKMIGMMPDLDPQKKTALEDRIAGYRLQIKQEREIAAQTAARAADAALKKAEAAFNAANALAEVGALNPEYSDKQLAVMAGTPYAAAFKEVLKRQAENGTLSAQAPATLRAQLDQVNARLATSATPELKAQRDRLSRIVDGQESAIKSEGLLRAANKYGVVTEPPKPLDMSGGLAGLATQLRERVPAATAAAQWAKSDPELLYPQEAMRVKEMIDMLPAKERAAAVAMLGQSMGPQASAGLAKQYERLTQGNNLAERALGYAMAMGTGQTTNDRLRSELVIKGADAIKSGASTKGEKVPGEKVSKWKTDISVMLEGFPDEKMRNQITEAALLVAHGIAAEEGGAMDKDTLARSVRLAIGGNMVERGVPVMRDGRKAKAFIPLPAGMDEDHIDKAIERLTPKTLGADELIVAGQRMPADQFLKKVLPNAPLSPVRPGVFAPLVGERSVLRPDGSRVTFEVR